MLKLWHYLLVDVSGDDALECVSCIGKLRKLKLLQVRQDYQMVVLADHLLLQLHCNRSGNILKVVQSTIKPYDLIWRKCAVEDILFRKGCVKGI